MKLEKQALFSPYLNSYVERFFKSVISEHFERHGFDLNLKDGFRFCSVPNKDGGLQVSTKTPETEYVAVFTKVELQTLYEKSKPEYHLVQFYLCDENDRDKKIYHINEYLKQYPDRQLRVNECGSIVFNEREIMWLAVMAEIAWEQFCEGVKLKHLNPFLNHFQEPIEGLKKIFNRQSGEWNKKSKRQKNTQIKRLGEDRQEKIDYLKELAKQV